MAQGSQSPESFHHSSTGLASVLELLPEKHRTCCIKVAEDGDICCIGY